MKFKNKGLVDHPNIYIYILCPELLCIVKNPGLFEEYKNVNFGVEAYKQVLHMYIYHMFCFGKNQEVIGQQAILKLEVSRIIIRR